MSVGARPSVVPRTVRGLHLIPCNLAVVIQCIWMRGENAPLLPDNTVPMVRSTLETKPATKKEEEALQRKLLGSPKVYRVAGSLPLLP
jgi:hypothetical protein